MSRPWNVFYSYAHQDAAMRSELSEFLAPLRHAGRLVEWYDRQIGPGTRWESEIAAQLDSADLIIMLISKSFLASEYCFGIEMERSMDRLKAGSCKVLPVLIGPCLWKESRFSELQCLPRNGKPVSAWPSQDEALAEIATGISEMVHASAPERQPSPAAERLDISVVRTQMVAYARLYERIRQQMDPSSERTRRMEDVFRRMMGLAMAAFPLLPELAISPSPGEKLAAIAILQIFANTDYLPFLVKAVGSEKPFIGYHAVKALEFAVSALEPRFYPALQTSLDDAETALEKAEAGFDTDRSSTLRSAKAALSAAMAGP